MDSRFKAAAILSSLAAILLVTVLVVYTNDEKETKTNTPQTAVASNKQPDDGTAASGDTDSSGGGKDLSAFLQDDSFFDTDLDSILETVRNNTKHLSMVITSIEKDLRIQVVNPDGVPVAGESFFVDVERADKSSEQEKTAGEGSYKDLDKDGIIYIGDMEAGDYYVKLQPLEGYRVPMGDTKVRVKDKVEYLAIEDISLLIKTEDEVDAAAEDSGQKDALKDADKTEIKELQAFTGRTRVGIDVSKWNNEIDWDRVKNAGVEFAIIRAGYRGSVTGSLVQDPYFDANMHGAAVSGIPVGVYFFTQATNEVEAVEEASAVLKWVREYDVKYPIFIDTEGAGGKGRADSLGIDMRTLVCEAFCRTIENAGYEAGVYASRNWYNHNLHTKQLENYYIWLAEYRSTPLYQGYYRMWQYTSKGSVDGIAGNVDMNVMYE